MIFDAKSYEEKSKWRVGDLLASLNRLSAGLFSSIRVAERQIAVLQDMHSIFSISYRRKTREGEEIYPLRQNPFQNIALAPISLENPEQIWPGTLDTIDEDRKSVV